MPMPQWLNDEETERARRAVDLAQRWISEAAEAHADPAAERLAECCRTRTDCRSRSASWTG